MPPELICVCGCNGVGKSTFIDFVYLSDDNYKNFTYINPDEIAKKENISNIEAGKIAIKLLNKVLNNHYNILKESTLVSNFDFKIIQQAKNLVILYIWIILAFLRQIFQSRGFMHVLQLEDIL